ncbi:MAG: hypothetical protein AB7E31_13520 [Desulfitobacterium sp.]
MAVTVVNFSLDTTSCTKIDLSFTGFVVKGEKAILGSAKQFLPLNSGACRFGKADHIGESGSSQVPYM